MQEPQQPTMEISDLSTLQKTDLANAIAMLTVAETTQSAFSSVFAYLGIPVPESWSYTETDDAGAGEERQLELYQQAEQLMTDAECLKYEVLLEVNDQESVKAIQAASTQIWSEFQDLDANENWEEFISRIQSI